MSAPFATLDFWIDHLEDTILKHGARPSDDAREGYELNCGRFVDRIAMCGAMKPNAPVECEFSLKVMEDGGIAVVWKAPAGGHVALVVEPSGRPHIVDEVPR